MWMDLASVFVAWAPDGSGLVLPIWRPSFHVFAIEDGLKRNFFGLRCQPNSSDEPVPERIEPVFLVTDQNPSLPGQSMYLVLQADVGDYSGALFSVERERERGQKPSRSDSAAPLLPGPQRTKSTRVHTIWSRQNRRELARGRERPSPSCYVVSDLTFTFGPDQLTNFKFIDSPDWNVPKMKARQYQLG